MQPVIKWVGGKRQLLPQIEKHVPAYNRYYEPFIGGGAVLFEICPKAATINDFNPELTNLYKVLKTKHRKLIELLKIHKQNNSEEYFYQIRGLDRLEEYSKLTDVERAARLIYMNKVCYNGLYRVNSAGHFNTPYGKYENPAIFDEANIEAVHNYLKTNDIKILTGDFVTAVSDAAPGDFVYFDPPYAPLSATANFTSYSSTGFSADDQRRLKALCDELNNKGIKFLLSNSNCEFIRDLYKDYEIEMVDAKRAINCKASKRGTIKEVLVKNYA